MRFDVRTVGALLVLLCCRVVYHVAAYGTHGLHWVSARVAVDMPGYGYVSTSCKYVCVVCRAVLSYGVPRGYLNVVWYPWTHDVFSTRVPISMPPYEYVCL